MADELALDLIGVGRTFLNGSVFLFKFPFFIWLDQAGAVLKGRWGHWKLNDSPVKLVMMASLFHMDNCRICVVYVQLSVRLLVQWKCVVVVFDRPCSKFVVLLLFRLYSCTFVNVYAVNGMSFTLFWGEKRQKCSFWYVYIHHSFPLGHNVYSFIWSCYFKEFMAPQSGKVLLFLILFLKGLPLLKPEL